MNARLHPAFDLSTPRQAAPDPGRVRAAFAALIEALGLEGAADEHTASRATALWLEHLVAGQHIDPSQALGPPLPSTSSAPIVAGPLGFHLVCPHHLTVASGVASLAYIPNGAIAGFGRLAKLVALATARLALQEEVAEQIAQTLLHGLGARAVAVVLRAQPPCLSLLHPRAHSAQVATWGLAGDARACADLQALIKA